MYGNLYMNMTFHIADCTMKGLHGLGAWAVLCQQEDTTELIDGLKSKGCTLELSKK